MKTLILCRALHWFSKAQQFQKTGSKDLCRLRHFTCINSIDMWNREWERINVRTHTDLPSAVASYTATDETVKQLFNISFKNRKCEMTFGKKKYIKRRTNSLVHPNAFQQITTSPMKPIIKSEKNKNYNHFSLLRLILNIKNGGPNIGYKTFNCILHSLFLRPSLRVSQIDAMHKERIRKRKRQAQTLCRFAIANGFSNEFLERLSFLCLIIREKISRCSTTFKLNGREKNRLNWIELGNTFYADILCFCWFLDDAYNWKNRV